MIFQDLNILTGIFLPGGRVYGKPLPDVYRYFYEKYGNIVRIPAHLRRPDTILLYHPDDFGTIFRTEGRCPTRFGMDSFEYYRTHIRPDVFETKGLVAEQGERWCKFRKIADPVVASPLTVNNYIPWIDEVTQEFIEMTYLSLDQNQETVPNFGESIQRWALEAMGGIALDTKLGVLGTTHGNKGIRLAHLVDEMFRYSYELDILPPLWRYITTPGFSKFMKVLDEITDITMDYVDEAMHKIETRGEDKPEAEQGVLEKMLKIDKKAAVIVSSDMLLSGIDTTSSLTKSLLYLLATNPDKQDLLRKELCYVLPDKTSTITPEILKRLPYMRACVKEGLRCYPVVVGTARTTTKDLVIQDYEIPEGTHVVMVNQVLYEDDEYFSNSKAFTPERWLKSDECLDSVTKNPFVYTPFGFGRRTCIGKRFAELEVAIFLTRFIREYEVSWNYGELLVNSSFVNTLKGEMKFQLKRLNV